VPPTSAFRRPLPCDKDAEPRLDPRRLELRSAECEGPIAVALWHQWHLVPVAIVTSRSSCGVTIGAPRAGPRSRSLFWDDWLALRLSDRATMDKGHEGGVVRHITQPLHT
jgi:hypothetical protein